MRQLGYNVYHAREGQSESFIGFVTSVRAAKKLAAAHGHEYELPASLYGTARAAGHVCGVTAPAGHEADEPTEWFGRGGYYCAVAVYDSPQQED